MKLILAVATAVLAGAMLSSTDVAAQSGALYAYCFEGQVPRLCEYDVANPQTPETAFPFVFSDYIRSSINGGKLLRTESANGRLNFSLSNIDGTNSEAFGSIAEGNGISTVSLSPDLKHVAYQRNYPPSLVVYTPETGDSVVVDDGTGFQYALSLGPPKWSPDGAWLLFRQTSYDSQTYQAEFIAVVPADGSEPARQLTFPRDENLPDLQWSSDEYFDWSFSGDRIAFIRRIPTQAKDQLAVLHQRIYTVAPDERTPTLVKEFTDFNNSYGLEWSGDDTELALLVDVPFTAERRILAIKTADGSTTEYRHVSQQQATYWPERLLQWTGTRGLIVNDAGDQPDAHSNDDMCDADDAKPGEQCTLRAAIQIANATQGPDKIEFDLPPSSLTINVTADLPAITDPVVIDGTTQDGYQDKPIVTVQGSGVGGFLFGAGDSEIRGLAITGFTVGVRMAGAGKNKIEGCYVGITAAGASAPNGNGIEVVDSPDNTIGGSKAEQRNVVSGNTGVGLFVSGETSTGITIAGNYIGTNAEGDAAVGNEGNGVTIDGAPAVLIGGSTKAERNVISGNGTGGIVIQGSKSDGTRIQGNIIGLGVDGSTAIGNGSDTTSVDGHHGIAILSAPNVMIGGAATSIGSPPGNVIAANAAHGIFATGTISGNATSDGLKILGNVIGTDESGDVAHTNGAEAIYLKGAVTGAQVGEAGNGNVIVSGSLDQKSAKDAVVLEDGGETQGAPDNATIFSNTIGLNASGSAVLGDVKTAVFAFTDMDERGVAGFSIGNSEATGNRIVAIAGISVVGARSSGSVIGYNTIGLLADGELARTEQDSWGVFVAIANRLQIGGNTIGGQSFGVILASDDNVLTTNRIGTNPSGTQARPNSLGIWIPGSFAEAPVGDRNRIGESGAGNLISGNKFSGIRIGGSFSARLNKRSTGALGILETTLRTEGLSAVAAPQDGLSPDSIYVGFNRIGTDQTGQRQIGNGRGNEQNAYSGLWISDGVGTTVIGNLISGNGGGIVIGVPEDVTGSPGNVTIGANGIGTDENLRGKIPNQYGGILIIDSENNHIIPLDTGDSKPVPNVIFGNGKFGVGVRSNNTEHGNQIRGNAFGENDGPSIILLDESLEYPSFAPAAPVVLGAEVTDTGARLRFTAAVTGQVDIYASPDCRAGNAEGAVIGTADVSAGTIDLPINNLPTSTSATRLYLAVTLTAPGETGNTSELSDCIRISRSSDVFLLPIAPRQTGPVADSLQIKIEITENQNSPASKTETTTGSYAHATSSAGTLYVTRFADDLGPIRGSFDGDATSSDGTLVEPNDVATERYWTLRSDSLSAPITYSVCVDYGGLNGVNDAGKLVVVHRERPNLPWTPLASTIIEAESRLCAEGLTTFGDIGIGADSLANPVANEPEPASTLPDGLSADIYPNPSAGSATLLLRLPEPGEVTVRIYDTIGREVGLVLPASMQPGEHQIALPDADWPSGVYFVRIDLGDSVLVRSLSVVR
ncbi:MAG: T9SS type A sorting domain-containing protein [Rhodothermales bacterium]